MGLSPSVVIRVSAQNNIFTANPCLVWSSLFTEIFPNVGMGMAGTYRQLLLQKDFLRELLDPKWILSQIPWQSHKSHGSSSPTDNHFFFFLVKKHPTIKSSDLQQEHPKLFRAQEFFYVQPQWAPSGLSYHHKKSGVPKVHAASRWAFFPLGWTEEGCAVRNIAHYLCISLYNQMKITLKINAELCKQHGYQDVTALCLFNPNTAQQSEKFLRGGLEYSPLLFQVKHQILFGYKMETFSGSFPFKHNLCQTTKPN